MLNFYFTLFYVKVLHYNKGMLLFSQESFGCSAFWLQCLYKIQIKNKIPLSNKYCPCKLFFLHENKEFDSISGVLVKKLVSLLIRLKIFSAHLYIV